MSHASVLVVLNGNIQPGDILGAVEEQMAPYQEGSWFEDGSRWDWWQIGGRFAGCLGASDVVRFGDVDLAGLAAKRHENAIANWHEAQKETEQMRDYIYGVQVGESLEAHLERRSASFAAVLPPHYALLRELHWNERERMGWFGMSTATECERKGELAPRCLHKDEKTGARIISWQCDKDSWNYEVWPKLAAQIEPDRWLVTVDYHV